MKIVHSSLNLEIAYKEPINSTIRNWLNTKQPSKSPLEKTILEKAQENLACDRLALCSEFQKVTPVSDGTKQQMVPAKGWLWRGRIGAVQLSWSAQITTLASKCSPQCSQRLRTGHSWTCAERQILDYFDVHIPNGHRKRRRSNSLFQFSCCEQVSFLQSIQCHVFLTFVLYFAISLFKIDPPPPHTYTQTQC